MGVFSEIAMEQQNSMFDSSAAFEDDEAFELEEMESLPVPPVGTDTVPVSAASVSAGETALADAEEEPADEVAPAGEEKSAEEGNSAQPPAAEDEEKKRAEYEAAEAQRKAEFDAKQQAKKAAEQEQIARLEAMSDEEVIAASTQRVSTDVEKLTRRNMKECVSEHIQMLCMEDTAFARLTMHPKKNMIRCFQYINRKAWDYVQDELKASGTRPGPGQQTYGCDVPDDMCYQWAEDYFRDPDAKEDHEDEEKFVPKPYAGKSSAKSKPKKAAEKKKTEPKAAPNGVILLYNKVRSKVNSELDLLLDEGDVDAILMGKKTQYPDAAIRLTEQMAQEFINDLFSTLRERMLDLQYCKVVFVGGGAILLKRQIETSGKVGAPFFVSKINANADGYEYLYRIETAGR